MTFPKPTPLAATSEKDVGLAISSARAFIRRYLRLQGRQFLLLAGLVTFAAAAAIGVQFMMKVLVDGMAAGRDQVDMVWRALCGFVALIAAESVLWRLSGWLGCRATIAAGVKMRHELFEHISGRPMRFFTDHMAGALGQRITSTAGFFGALVNTVVWRIMPPGVDFLGALLIFATVDPWLAVGLAVAVLSTTFGLITFGERGRGLHRNYAALANSVGGDLVDVLSNMWSVKAFSARARESQRLCRGFEAEAVAQRASWMHIERARVLHDLALWLMAGMVLAYAIHLWVTGRITPGDVVLVSALTFRILHGSRDVALSLVDMVQQFGFIEETLRVIGTEQEHDGMPASQGGRRDTSIEFRNVSFRYEKCREVLHGIDLFIPPGQKVGIVGPSGAGKSTIIHLLQRLYETKSGDIFIGGLDIRTVPPSELRTWLSVVPQEIGLFHRSILENIRIARPDAADADVLAAADAAQCLTFINRLPNGLQTTVGERGAKLSGGQRQRIGIARALLMDSPIVVMDEATSALDSETEQHVLRAFSECAAKKTVISVAHRLSSLAAFDRILVLHEGEIVEDGTFSDLRRSGGVFEDLWRRQAAASLLSLTAG
jgi:ATP-binding cassette subfamily B protein